MTAPTKPTVGGSTDTWGTIANAAFDDLGAQIDTKAPTAAGMPTGGTTGQVLSKTSGTNYAVAWSASGATTLDGLTNVTVPTPADGDVLTYDTAVTAWVSQPPPSTSSIDASAITSGLLAIARAPAGSVFNYDKTKGGFGTAAGSLPSTRPSSRTDITFIWTSDTDPAAIAIAGDKWDTY